MRGGVTPGGKQRGIHAGAWGGGVECDMLAGRWQRGRALLNVMDREYAQMPVTRSRTMHLFPHTFSSQAVQVWDMSGRTVYCCPTCQPLRAPGSSSSRAPTHNVAAGAALTPRSLAVRPGLLLGGNPSPADAVAAGLSPARQAALAAATPAQPFRSHCAPDERSSLEATPVRMTVAELKVPWILPLCISSMTPSMLNPSCSSPMNCLLIFASGLSLQAKLSPLGLSTTGAKAQLVERFERAQRRQQELQQDIAEARGAPPLGRPSDGRRGPDSLAADEERSGSEDELDLAEMLLSGRLTPSTPGGAFLPAYTPSTPGSALLHSRTGGAFLPSGISPSPVAPSAPATFKTRGRTAGKIRGQQSLGQMVTPGTAALAAIMASAAEAAEEKARAAEGRNVEHVALVDDATEALRGRKRRHR